MSKWPPDARVTNYRGPYPKRELYQARTVLIRCLQDSNPLLSLILPKIGIDMTNGSVIPCPLPPIIQDIKPMVMNNGCLLPDNYGAVQTPFQPVHHVNSLTPPLQIVRLEHLRRPLLPSPLLPDPMFDMFDDGSSLPTIDSVNIFSQRDGTFRESPFMSSTLRYFDGKKPNEHLWSPEIQSLSGSVTSLYSLTEREFVPDLYSDDATHTTSKDDNKEGIGTIVKSLDVDISNEALKHILDLVGQTNPVNNKPESSTSESLLGQTSEISNENRTPSPSVVNKSDCKHEINDANSNCEGILSQEPYKPESKHENGVKLPTDSVTGTDEMLSLSNGKYGQQCTEANTEICESASTFHVFKCDFCSLIIHNLNEMNSHLSVSKHSSGSEYIAKSDGCGKLELLYVERMLAVKNPVPPKSSNMVIACPECREIFDDIFMCSQHYKYEHDSLNGFYVICPIIHSAFVCLDRNLACTVCQNQFTTWQALYDHWSNFQNHSPLELPSNRQVFNIYICLHCDRIFKENFVDAANHAADHLKDSVACGKDINMETKQVMLPMRKEILCDFNPCASSNGIKDEFLVLQQLCSSCRLISGFSAASARIEKINDKMSRSHNCNS